MSLFEAMIYGIIQGIAEFLPVSSSGHLALAQNFFGAAGHGGLAFNVLLHLATLVSVCAVFRKDVFALIKGFFTLMKKLFTGKIKQGLDSGERLFVMLCIATLPLIPVKLLGLDEKVEALSSVSWAIGLLLIANGLMLFLSDRISKGSVKADSGGYLRPLGIGIIQAAFGILPGISRSGSTITAGRIAGYSREEAVRFSFLMSIPAIAGACVAELPDLFAGGIPEGDVLPMAAGAFTAAAVGFGAIKLLQYITKKKSFAFFAAYCVLIGAAAVIADLVI